MRLDRKHHQEPDGSLYVFQDKDETRQFVMDWTLDLGSDTISTVTAVGSGVSLVSSSNTNKKVTALVSGTDGFLDVTISTAASQVFQETLN